MNGDAFCDAIHEEAISTAASVRAEYDEIGRPSLSYVQNGSARIAHGNRLLIEHFQSRSLQYLSGAFDGVDGSSVGIRE